MTSQKNPKHNQSSLYGDNALRHFAHANSFERAHSVRFARHPKANSLIGNVPNIKHLVTKTSRRDAPSTSESKKNRDSARDLALRSLLWRASCERFCFSSGNKIVDCWKFEEVRRLFCVVSQLIVAATLSPALRTGSWGTGTRTSASWCLERVAPGRQKQPESSCSSWPSRRVKVGRSRSWRNAWCKRDRFWKVN